MTSWVRMRRDLSSPVPPARWPPSVRCTALERGRERAFHALLTDGHGERVTVAPFERWWRNVRDDSEFDPGLCLTVLDDSDEVVAVALCWSRGFLKDLVVSRGARQQGIARNLLQHLFGLLRERGLSSVDLKVERDNPHGAFLFYRRMGFVVLADEWNAWSA